MAHSLTPEQLAQVRERTAAARAALAHKPGIEDTDLADAPTAGAPFYSEMLRCVGRLRSAREAAGWDVAEAARRAGVGADELGRLERGELPNPDWRLLGRYAVAVGHRLDLTAAPKAVPAA